MLHNYVLSVVTRKNLTLTQVILATEVELVTKTQVRG